MDRIHWFQIVSIWILTTFMGIMVYVTYLAYSRVPGSTGQDMSLIQQIRYDNRLGASSQTTIHSFQN